MYNTKIRQELKCKYAWFMVKQFVADFTRIVPDHYCLKVLLIFISVYLLTKITLRDICHELSK